MLESGVQSVARVEFTAYSLLFTVPETRFADFGQNSTMLSEFGKIRCFFRCYFRKLPAAGSWGDQNCDNVAMRMVGYEDERGLLYPF
jgi:hypothetical protein